MKYPKLWNNSSAVGESLVRSLQRIDTPFLSAHAPGVEANKMNRLSEVKSGGGYRYYIYDEFKGGPFFLRAAYSYKHRFKKISSHGPDEGVEREFTHWGSSVSAGKTVFKHFLEGSLSVIGFSKNDMCRKTMLFTQNRLPTIVSLVHGAVSKSDVMEGAIANTGFPFTQYYANSSICSGWLNKLYPPPYQFESWAKRLWSVNTDIMEYPPPIGGAAYKQEARDMALYVCRAGPERLYAFSFVYVRMLVESGGHFAEEYSYLPSSVACVMYSNNNGRDWSAVNDDNFVTIDKYKPGNGAKGWYPDNEVMSVEGAPGQNGDLIACVGINWWGEYWDEPPGGGAPGTLYYKHPVAEVWRVSPSGLVRTVSEEDFRSVLGDSFFYQCTMCLFTPVRMEDHILALVRPFSSQGATVTPKLVRLSVFGDLEGVVASSPVAARHLGMPSVTHDKKFACPMYFPATGDDVAGVYACIYNGEGGWDKNGLIAEISAERYSAQFSTIDYFLPVCMKIEYVLTAGGNAAPTYPAAPELGKAG